LTSMGAQYDPDYCIIFTDLVTNKSVLHPDTRGN